LEDLEFLLPKVSIVLPTYNEKDNIVDLIYGIQRNLGESVEIIIVDDDSPDKTWQHVERLVNEHIKLLRRTDKRGLTSAIADGIALTKGNIVGWMDCDFSMPPEILPVLINTLDKADIAVGSRFIKGGLDDRDTPFEMLSTKLLNLFARLILTSKIYDYTSGFVVAKREVLEEIELRGDYGEYCIDFLYKAFKKNFKIIEIPYTCIPRRFGESKTAPSLPRFFMRGIKYFKTIIRLRFYY
jgi:dolichol-phosphate mannosyltransferase